MEIQDLKILSKKSEHEIPHKETFYRSQILVPFVSDDEQREIEAEFGLPEASGDEFIDMTDWVKGGSP